MTTESNMKIKTGLNYKWRDIKEKFLILYRQLNIIKIAVEYSGIFIIGAKHCQEWLDAVDVIAGVVN